ncbi:MAG: hypothetical protein BWY82_02122 [Verrucomicrobia bacterium ADurb.Bin474]|nr:MAG: hypothetical protein BWY82_02122 [Verrucomicrobia bacterium ADurb.Bin474]
MVPRLYPLTKGTSWIVDSAPKNKRPTSGATDITCLGFFFLEEAGGGGSVSKTCTSPVRSMRTASVSSASVITPLPGISKRPCRLKADANPSASNHPTDLSQRKRMLFIALSKLFEMTLFTKLPLFSISTSAPPDRSRSCQPLDQTRRPHPAYTTAPCARNVPRPDPRMD